MGGGDGRKERGKGGYVLHTLSFPAATQTVIPIRTTAATALFTATDFIREPSDMFATCNISIASMGVDKSKGLTDVLIAPASSAFSAAH